MLTNLFYLIIISLLLIAGGWTFKAAIALLQGQPINMNILNPLNLKARWPKENKKPEEKV